MQKTIVSKFRAQYLIGILGNEYYIGNTKMQVVKVIKMINEIKFAVIYLQFPAINTDFMKDTIIYL